MLLLGLLVRVWPWLAEPLLPWEDGALFFAQNYAEFEWVAAIHPYAGYVPIGSNLQALVVCRAPTTWIPTVFVLSAVLMLLGAAATLLRPAWQRVAPFATRLLLAAAVAWVPFGSNLELTSLAYSQWPQLLWLFFLVVEPAEGRALRSGGQLVRSLLIAFLTLCNPVGIVLLPIVLLLLRSRTTRLDGVAYLLAIVAYLAVIQLFRDEALTPSFAALWSDFVPAMIVSVFVEAFAGVGGMRGLMAVDVGAEWGVGLVVLAVVAWVVWRSWGEWSGDARRLAIAGCWLAVTTIAVSLVIRPGWMSEESHVVRYAWLARAVTWLLTCLGLATLLGPVRAALIVAGLAVGLSFGNAGLHRHGKGGAEVAGFMQQLAAQEAELGGRRWIRTRFQPANGPPIVIWPH